MINQISPSDLNARYQQDAGTCLIDVRTPLEYSSVHAVGAVNLPLDRICGKALQELGVVGKPIHIICKSGGRSSSACQKLLAEGVQGIVNVEGGTDAWVAAGLPVVRGKPSLSVEQQTRIGAGLMIIFGTLLGAYVHPAYLAITAFVGIGLFLAGATGWCGMGYLLAKMPWNQKGAK